MKRFALTAVVLVLCIGLCAGCGTSESADPVVELVQYDHPAGISIRMPAGFTQGNVEGVLACYEGEEANVRFAEEPFESLEMLGYSRDMTEAEYAELIRESYGFGGEIGTDEYGTVCYSYTQEIQNTPVAYYAFFEKGEYSFWTTTFMCMGSQSAKLEADFHLWASTVDTSRAAKPVVESVPMPLTEEETEELVEIIEKIEPIDFLGRSLTPDTITNEEMLRIVYDVFDAQQYGIVGIDGEYFLNGIAVKYFGYDQLSHEDIVCSCGETLATYDAGEDAYDWEGAFHDYTLHTCDVYNLYQQAYMQNDAYIVTAYKLFSDLTENVDGDSLSFYACVADAQNQENALFAAASEEEFSAALDSLSADQLTLYTYTFVMDEKGRFVLAEYVIGE